MGKILNKTPCKIIAITNQKGGVGKTTTAVNLCAALYSIRRKVLMVDLDPQGNATMGCGVNKNDLQLSVYNVLENYKLIENAIINSVNGGFDLLPGNADLTASEVALLSAQNREYSLDKALKQVENKYDYILIDCPPSLNMLTVNALTAAQSVLIPMQCEYYALEGLSALITTINGICNTLNSKLKIEGLIRTMYDSRNSLTKDVSAQLFQHFGNKVYNTVIPRNIRLAEAPSYGLPAMLYDKRSKGAIAYLALAGELLRKSTP